MAQVPARTGKWTDRHDEIAAAAGFESWEVWIGALEAERDRPICGVISKSRNAPCLGKPSAANGRCYNHGANAASGPDAGQYQHGRFVRALPSRMRSAALDTLQRKEVSLWPQIALLDAREEELLQALEHGGGIGDIWAALSRDMETLRDALSRGDGPRATTTLSRLAGRVAAGSADARVWDELRTNSELRSRLMREQREIDARADTTMTLTDAMAYFEWLADVWRGVLEDVAMDAVLRTALRRRFADEVRSKFGGIEIVQ